MIKELLRKAALDLKDISRTPLLDAELLLQSVLGVDKIFLISNNDIQLSKEQEDEYFKFVSERKSLIPISYLTGTKEFYGRDFLITKDVLVPRPETEILVEESLKVLSSGKRVLEVGVGSGCVIITLCLECEGLIAFGSDISDEALKVAAKNKDKYKIKSLELINSDLFENITGKFDLIVSNPPYVPIGQADPSTKHEPDTALYAGEDGFDVIDRLVKEAPKFLNPGGALLFECGIGQAERFKGAETFKDLQGIERVVKVSYPNFKKTLL